jgi:putative CocE/NonD family hydrolase
MKKIIIFVCLSVLIFGALIWHKRYRLVANYYLVSDGMRSVEFAVCLETDLEQLLSDGVVLRADRYYPCGQSTAPTILVRIPYSAAPKGTIRRIKNELGLGAIAHFWASRGYNTIVQGTRGRYKSGGEFYPLVHERRDGIETLTWLGKQTWFDGRLGMWGGSAFGHTQWAIADKLVPGLSALNIHIASTNFREMFHPGGAFALESALFWALRSHGAEDLIPDQETLNRGFNGWPLIAADDRAAQDIEFFNDWATHSNPNKYWLTVDGQNRAQSLKAPVLFMAGWSDPFLPTQLRDFQLARQNSDPNVANKSQLIIGPWTHADSVTLPDGSIPSNYRKASIAWSLPWFDHHLLGWPLENVLRAPVLIYVRGDNVWRPEQEWPLARAEPTQLYLTSSTGNTENLALSFGKPNGSDISVRYIYDPENPTPSRGGAMLGGRAGIKLQNDIASRTDVLAFTGETLADDIEITGPVHAILNVTSSASSTDFVVKLVDIHPDGRAFNVTSGILRKSYANVNSG